MFRCFTNLALLPGSEHVRIPLTAFCVNLVTRLRPIPVLIEDTILNREMADRTAPDRALRPKLCPVNLNFGRYAGPGVTQTEIVSVA